MTEPLLRKAGRPGAMTIFVAVTGLGSAALVTSISALSAASDTVAVAVAVVGGTVVLGTAALVTLVCALRMPGDVDRGAWTAVGLSLVLTTVASGLRSGQMLRGELFIRAEVSEWVYTGGAVLLLGVLLAWPIRYRDTVKLATLLLEALVASAVAIGAGWFVAGRYVLEYAAEYGGIGPRQATQFLVFLAVLAVAAVFTIVCAVNLRAVSPPGPWVLAAVGTLLIVAGDLAWIADMSDASWAPGSLGDFSHIAGHVLLAVGASMRLDYVNALAAARRRDEPGEQPGRGAGSAG